MTQGQSRLSSQSLCLHWFQINMNMDYTVEIKASQGPHPQDVKSPSASPPGKVVIRTHGLPKKQVQVHVLKRHLCKKTSDTEKKLWIHSEQAHKGFSFHCQYCNKKCGSRSNLHWHEHTHEVFKHKCDICLKRFQYPGGLKTHMKIHTGTNLIPCLYCCLKFMTNKAMKNHTTNKAMKNHAKKHNAMWTKCDYCSESFDTTWNKKQHERGPIERVGKPHVAKSVHGQKNYDHTKKFC